VALRLRYVEPTMTRIWVRLCLIACVSAFVGCGDSDPDLLPASAVRGTAVYFDLDSDLGDPSRFYDFPFPSDLRLHGDGTPDLRGFPYPPSNRILPPVLRIAAQRQRAPTTAVANFRFDGALAARNVLDVIRPEPSAALLLVDIDRNSPQRGQLFPVVASTPPPDAYVPEHLLSVAAAPGVILSPSRSYAFVVLRSLGDARGTALGVPLSLVQLSRGETPDGGRGTAARASYEPMWEVLDRIGVRRHEVAAASVFGTTDVVADLAALSDSMVDRFAVDIEDVVVEPAAGGDRFCVITGHVRLPQFQAGTPPFNTQGQFEYAQDGAPIVQREQEVPLVLTLPRREMPAGGYPLVVYAHGSGGSARQVVDRGPTTQVGGSPRAGEGPAHVLAEHGFATVGMALPLNPERLPGGDPRAYLNLRNLAAYPDTFRQGVIELRLILESLRRLRLDVDGLSACSGLSVPAGMAQVGLRSDPLYVMGQSLGAQYATLLAAVEPRVHAVVPTASGGLLSRVILAASGEGSSSTLVNSLLGTPAALTYLHPGLQLVQLGFEPVDPIVFAPRIAIEPLAGHPSRSIYTPVGRDDPQFPSQIYDAMAVAYGTQQAGTVLWPGLQSALALRGRDGVLAYPVSANGRSLDGRAYTGVVVQYDGDDILDAHHIAAQLEAVKHQYGCFLRSIENGVPRVFVGALPGAACAE